MRDSFCYSFRFCCDPGFNDEREIKALPRFIKEADIDDVSVFCNVEEINIGHMTFEEQKRYLDLLNDVKNTLAPMGITMSVNHWHSLMHADLGKHFKPGQNFRPMVDIDGKKSDLCVCPMCENWQEYFTGLYSKYAEINPNIMWVEDDFRLHNHDPLNWGGCFCDAHMKEYSKRAGKELTREEFLKGVLKPGKPHPYRKIWLDVNRETMVSLAEKIGKAVHKVSPETRVGLMSSVPFVHSAEGRDWKGILNGFAQGNHPVNRIHLPAYSEIAPKDYLLRFNMVSMENRAFIPENTDIYPELENYPYSLFAKSRKFTRFQFLSAMPLDLAGMTIDLFDLNGSGIAFSEKYQNMLHEVKPFLNMITKSGIMSLNKLGVNIMVCETSSYTLQTGTGESMEELYPQEVYYAGILNAMGISYKYCTNPEITGEIIAVSGQYFRNLTKEQIKKLIDGNMVILRGDAVETLVDMGLGSLIGVKSCIHKKQNSGAYTYEEVCDGKIYGDLPKARSSSVISGTDVLDIQYENEPEVQTRFYDSFGNEAMIGHAIIDNHIIMDPFCGFESPDYIPPMQLNAVRRDLMQSAVKKCFDGLLPVVLKKANLQPYSYIRDSKLYVYLINGSLDDSEDILLNLGTTDIKDISITNSACGVNKPEYRISDGNVYINADLKALDACLLTFEL